MFIKINNKNKVDPHKCKKSTFFIIRFLGPLYNWMAIKYCLLHPIFSSLFSEFINSRLLLFEI